MFLDFGILRRSTSYIHVVVRYLHFRHPWLSSDGTNSYIQTKPYHDGGTYSRNQTEPLDTTDWRQLLRSHSHANQ